MNTIYNNLVIYYFSGTGNARRSSEWIAELARSECLNVYLTDIDRFEKVTIPDLRDGRTLIGFAYPTHGFNAAPTMLRFMSLFPKQKNCDIFLINTRAGMKLSKVFLPGISGLAQYLPALIMLLKGFRIVAMKPVDLPSNWISLHPGLKEGVVRSIFIRWKRKMKFFAHRLLSGRRNYRALFDFPIDIWLFPISIGYYFVGRFALAKTFIATDSCNSCGLCVKQCPTNSIKMSGDYPYWKLTCESCMRCMNNCPQRAIETAHTVSGILWYLTWGLAAPFFFTSLINSSLFPATLNKIWLKLIDWGVWALTTIIFITLAYYLIHYLLRFRIFNKFIAYTSLTHYKFWRRYKAPSDI